MNRSLVRSVVILFSCFTLISFAVVVNPPVVTTSDVSGARALPIDSNLLVWGITPKGGISVTMYNPALKEICSFKKDYPSFSGGEVQMEILSDTSFQFTLTGKDKRQRVFIFLNKKLVERYNSKPAGNPTLPAAVEQQIISRLHDETISVTLENEIIHPAPGKDRRVTKLKQVGVNDSLNAHSWTILIDSTAIEYGKVMMHRGSRIYVYVNHSMEKGQFVYCFDEKDGTQIYRTKLLVKATDFKRGESMSSGDAFVTFYACIYSNHCWDDRTKRLTIAGTWVGIPNAQYPEHKNSGLFLIQLNDNGEINASDADYNYWLHSNTTGIYHAGDGFFSRNTEPYYRIADMGYESDGAFSLFAEVYAHVRLWSTLDDPKGYTYMQDSMYHYFAVQKHYYSVFAGSIRPRCQECIVRTIPWAANYHLDSIRGFVPQKTKLYDEQYPDNINMICDASRADGHFIAGLRKLRGRNGTKILTKNKVDVNGKVYDAYFTKTLYVPSANWIAFLSPDPVKGQDFSKPAEYFAANSDWLYRFEVKGGGYEIRMARW